MVYSSRDEEEIAYRTELEGLTQQNPHFRVYHTLTRPSKGSTWTGRRGRVNADILAEAMQNLSQPVIYVCGSDGFVQETVRIVAELGTPREQIRYEVFRGYD
jgi:ferredoxin-NADP reductase